jgi:hypothetical protein
VRRPKTSENLGRAIDTAKEKVADAENRMLEERTKSGIISIEDSKKAIAMTIEKTENALDDLSMDMQIASMVISELKKGLPATASSHLTNGTLATTNEAQAITPAIAQEYRAANTILNSLRAKESDLLTQTTTNNPYLRSVEASIVTTEEKCRQLVEKYPGLVAMKQADSGPSADPMAAYQRELLHAQILGVKYRALTNQLAAAKLKQAKIVVEEGPILDLQRENDRYRANLDNSQKRQGESELDAILEPGNSQISEIELPTPPTGDFAKVDKTCAGVLIGGLLLAIGLPFLI